MQLEVNMTIKTGRELKDNQKVTKNMICKVTELLENKWKDKGKELEWICKISEMQLEGKLSPTGNP